MLRRSRGDVDYVSGWWKAIQIPIYLHTLPYRLEVVGSVPLAGVNKEVALGKDILPWLRITVHLGSIDGIPVVVVFHFYYRIFPPHIYPNIYYMFDPVHVAHHMSTTYVCM